MKTYQKTTITREPLLQITLDNDAESPREWSSLGYFITIDKNYNSPDKAEILEMLMKQTGEMAENEADHARLLKKAIKDTINEKVLAIYPVYKYEHSDIVYSIGTASGFDISNNGFYIITDKTQKEIGTKKKDFERIAREEIKTYNHWIGGSIYKFCLYDNEGEIVDSCGGFYEVEDIKKYLPKEWAKTDLNEYVINN